MLQMASRRAESADRSAVEAYPVVDEFRAEFATRYRGIHHVSSPHVTNAWPLLRIETIEQ